MKNWLWAIWQGFTPCDKEHRKELPNAALCKWADIDKVGCIGNGCRAMSALCHKRFDTPACRRLYERRDEG